MVCATVQVLLPGPVVLERHELVEVSAAVDHHFFVNGDAGAGAFEFGEAFSYVQCVQRFLGANQGSGVGGGHGAGLLSRETAGAVEAVHVGFVGVTGVGRFGDYFAVFFVEFVPAQHGDETPA